MRSFIRYEGRRLERGIVNRPPQHASEAADVEAKASAAGTVSTPLRSVHTNSFAQILDQLKVSLAVTTYQAGKLVLLRPQLRSGRPGEAAVPVLNTHFRGFNKPMGFAWEPGRFALGTASEVWEFHDIPAVASKLEAANSVRHDACFLPRSCHVTGDVQIHEMAWVPTAGGGGSSSSAGLSELCFVNTRFSCLATRSGVYSFVPHWKPPFISGLAPEDRCHLNGLGLRDGRLRYVTALGETDSPAGWRDNKRSGGIVMDIPSGEVIVCGLSMPHSPRWHEGRLWVLESGNGGVGVVDEKTGSYQEICRLPGFTRGLDFAGPYAFVGLSQVRESAVFSGISIAQTPQAERCCGVWAIDTRRGQVAGFVKFMDAVQEIFAVQALRGVRWPEVLSEDPLRIAETFELPDDALRLVPPNLRQTVGSVSTTAAAAP
jgi:uncharacterized protein (TIGR03032 family)